MPWRATWILLLMPAVSPAGSLLRIDAFGSNPGNLQMIVYLPDGVPASAPLVVALHGCTQDAITYANAGWRDLADEQKFLLLLPDQSAAAHWINSCWNWSRTDHATRAQGEAQSIVSMVDYLKRTRGIDTRRIFVDGLSAGGWLTSELLVAYPDVFAGGATHAGGPAYCAAIERPWWDFFGNWTTWSAATRAGQCMRGQQLSPADWARQARARMPAGFDGRWPILSIWHGTGDGVVSPDNQRELMEQWTALHGADQRPDTRERLGPRGDVQHERHVDRGGRTVVETYRIAGMTHGIAIDGAPGARCGEPSAFVLDVGVCAVRRISGFWGLGEGL